ncbi:hypothetical protein GFB56_25420 [Ensifer sp. T173]|uniref:DUF883 domain-containing protein n=1 Tax=Ensifer canadensis TaxID=555315 RepID=A0AAW4FRU5_9HYPH|nr:hypothetical protein [Ensifer canadensis]MBM3094089.1 hypothetical protein [Ensifer canadensis]NOV19566.1 hypothetical protein [Ensifer canadensis]UBI78274.1 hypothetical protein J3R84_27615 [Ensifer canadensis]
MANDIQRSVEDQISELRAQVADLTRSISARAGEAAGSAADLAEDARGRVSSAARVVRTQGQSVVEAAKDNPGTATTVVSTAGLIGFAIGVLVGVSFQSNARWR